ncbi:hypothetical protein GCM10027345_28130 [Hymenobacter daeguensis]
MPVRLDLIGATGLISGNRVVGVSDTLITRAYAEGNDVSLTHMRITVKYEPTRYPFLYPLPITSYDPTTTPNDDELVYADSVIANSRVATGNGVPRGGAFLFNNKFSARTTSGTERWQYTATDDNQATAARVLRLTARNRDSALVYHSYTARLRPVIRRSTRTADSAQVRDGALVFLNLRTGLLLPKYALINNEKSPDLQSNQLLVDLICVAKNTTTVILAAPAETNPANLRLNSATWPVDNRHATQLHATNLSDTDFANAATTQAFEQAFAGGLAYSSLSTTPLAKGQVIAFRVVENNQNYTGLLLVSDLVFGSNPRITCLVKVQK